MSNHLCQKIRDDLLSDYERDELEYRRAAKHLDDCPSCLALEWEMDLELLAELVAYLPASPDECAEFDVMIHPVIDSEHEATDGAGAGDTDTPSQPGAPALHAELAVATKTDQAGQDEDTEERVRTSSMRSRNWRHATIAAAFISMLASVGFWLWRSGEREDSAELRDPSYIEHLGARPGMATGAAASRPGPGGDPSWYGSRESWVGSVWLATGGERSHEPLGSVKIVIDSHPLGAEVFANGRRVCATPCIYTVERGASLSLVLRKSGYEEIELRLRANRDQVQSLTLPPKESSANIAAPRVQTLDRL